MGMDETLSVGLAGSDGLSPFTAPSACSSPVGWRDRGLGIGACKRNSAARPVGTGVGLERLRARPKMSLAAEATVHADPPLTVARSLPRSAPGDARGSGPPSPPAGPVRVDTSEAIVSD